MKASKPETSLSVDGNLYVGYDYALSAIARHSYTAYIALYCPGVIPRGQGYLHIILLYNNSRKTNTSQHCAKSQ